MNKIEIKNWINNNEASIKVGIGIGGFITTIILVDKASPKAKEILNEYKYNIAKDQDADFNDVQISALDKIGLTWKLYLPPIITGMLSTAIILNGNKQHLKKSAVLGTAYGLSETAFKEYVKKVKDTIGEEKEQKIHDTIIKDKMDITNFVNREVIITNQGNVLIYDIPSDRYFRSDVDIIKRIVNNINKRLRDEMFISLNDFYCEIGLKPRNIDECLGWNIDHGYFDIHYSSQLTENDEPCVCLDYELTNWYS